MFRIMVFLNILVFCTLGQAEEQDRYILCKNNRTVRTVRVSHNESSCQVIYAKEGQDKVVGSARLPASCEQIASSIEKNLASAGWKCRDISSSASVVEPRQ